MRIYPSLIAANPLRLYDTIKHLEGYCAGFHCDIMDNHFVPNLTFGVTFAHAIDAATKTQTWIHLMVDNPLDWCKKLQLKENTIVSFHTETNNTTKEVIQVIKEKKWRASVAIKPKTDVGEVFSFLNLIDQVLIMSVEPGFSGQHFLNNTLLKIDPLITYRKKENLNFSIGMDGGISLKNIKTLACKEINEVAIASAIFNQPDPLIALQELTRYSHQK